MITHRVIKNIATVTVAQDKLTFDSQREFRQQVNAAINNAGVSVVTIDMEAVEYIDSAALGMFLIMRDAAEVKNVRVRIINCAVSVKQIFEIANFQKLFDIV